MKDEEMAEEWINNEISLGTSMYNPQIEYYCKQAFLAGLKAGKREKWHDLRKTPNDLPKPTTPVLVILESGVPYVSWISSDKGWWFCTNYYTGEDKVIAWCEIPTFDKE